MEYDIIQQNQEVNDLLSKQDFEDMDNKIKEIVEKSVDEISINTEFPPTTDDLKNNNEAYSIMAAILFIDISFLVVKVISSTGINPLFPATNNLPSSKFSAKINSPPNPITRW